MTGPLLPRRAVIKGGLLAGIAGALAGCIPSPAPTSGSAPSPRVPSPSPSGPQATGLSSASAEPSVPAPSPTVAPPSLEAMIAGLLVIGFRGARLRDAPWIEEAFGAGLGGVVLFDRDQLTGDPRNVRSPDQLRALTAELREAAGRPLIVAVDQEGGVVTRLSPAHGFPELASEATVGRGTTAEARRWARGLARTLADAGISVNFAPVVDLNVNPRSPAIGALDRSFSADPDVVAKMAKIEIDAHRAAGVATTLKHFPGIGSSTTNTDFGVADVTDTWTRRELEPFRRLIAAGEADLVMAGHVVNRTLDRRHPASLSPAVVTDLLRGELGWEGVVVTDDLQAAAIVERFGAEEAVLLALLAGNDVLLFANQQTYDPRVVEVVVGHVARAVADGRLDAAAIEASWRRVQALFGGASG